MDEDHQANNYGTEAGNSFTIYLSCGLVISNVVNVAQGAVGLDCPDTKLGADSGNHTECVGKVLQRDYWGLHIQATVHTSIYRENLSSVFLVNMSNGAFPTYATTDRNPKGRGTHQRDGI